MRAGLTWDLDSKLRVTGSIRNGRRPGCRDRRIARVIARNGRSRRSPAPTPAARRRARTEPRSTRWSTSWAMRSPRCTSCGVVGSVLSSTHHELAAVAGVDEAGRVHAGDAVACGEPAAGEHEPGPAVGDGDGDARRHQRPPAGGREHAPSRAIEVGAGVAERGVRRQRQVGVEHAAPAPSSTQRHSARARGTVRSPRARLDRPRDDRARTGPPRRSSRSPRIVTDDDLAIVAEGPDLVVHQPPEVLAQMDDFVRQMHTEAGCCRSIEASTITLAEAGAADARRSSRSTCPRPGTVPLCGNSIGTDRRFLAKYLPEIEDYLHYRSVDVSTIKELARRWYPEAARSAARQGGSPPGPRRHQRESIDELRFYRERSSADR